MTQDEFEKILDRVCIQLTNEAHTSAFKKAMEFESRVRSVLHENLPIDSGIEIDFDPPAQGFPDIDAGYFGVEVKFTLQDTWRSIANSIRETSRVETVNKIYLVFGKMGGVPEVRWGDYEQSVIHVRTSHVPRFEVELFAERSLFSEMGISYNDFRSLPMEEKMKYIRTYARGRLRSGERLWWLENNQEEEHSLPIQARLYTSLSMEEKLQLRAEAALLSPKIVKSGRAKNKYDDVVLYLLTYHGVISHQARDLFSAGSVANPENDDKGGLYIERALRLIEKEMIDAALRMDDALFIEYWGESVEPKDRICRWLQKADAIATNWVPSERLFLSIRCSDGKRIEE